MQSLEALTRDARALANGEIVLSAPETEVARQLGNTPAVCKKAYVHPAVLELGSRLASDAGPGLQRVWQRIGSAASPRGLSAAERRLLAFLRLRPASRVRRRPRV